MPKYRVESITIKPSDEFTITADNLEAAKWAIFEECDEIVRAIVTRYDDITAVFVKIDESGEDATR